MPMTHWRAANKRRRAEPTGSVEWLKHTFLAWVACIIFAVPIALVVAFAFLFAAPPALGQVSVPFECVQLAAREGFPTDVLTRTQAARARYRMSRLSDDDPIVRPCRNAIAQLRAMQRELKK